MRFEVSEDMFNRFPNLCVAVVVAEGIDNTKLLPETEALLAEATRATHEILKGTDLKARPEIAVWREAFKSMGINPNKYSPSIEALLKRIAKKPDFPSINAIVNLVNAISIKNMVPMGAHDLGKIQGDIRIRLSREGDHFTPFGSREAESVPPGEPVYADDLEVRTRIWVWRQGENAKVTEESSRIFFPIDGFMENTQSNMLAARDQLSEILKQTFRCSPGTYWIDAGTPGVELQL